MLEKEAQEYLKMTSAVPNSSKRVNATIEHPTNLLYSSIGSSKDESVHNAFQKAVSHVLRSTKPSWLRAELGALLAKQDRKNTDFVILARLIFLRLFCDPRLRVNCIFAKFGHFTKDDYITESGKRSLMNIVRLVSFLYGELEHRLISYNPDWFLPDTIYKFINCSVFAMDAKGVSGERSLFKLLDRLGYFLICGQTYVDEFQFRSNIVLVDLRVDVILARIVELLSDDLLLTIKLRYPHCNLLRNRYNLSLLLEALTKHNIISKASNDFNSKIMEGERKNMVELLWCILLHFFNVKELNTEDMVNQLFPLVQGILHTLTCNVTPVSLCDLKKIFKAATIIQRHWRKTLAKNSNQHDNSKSNDSLEASVGGKTPSCCTEIILFENFITGPPLTRTDGIRELAAPVACPDEKFVVWATVHGEDVDKSHVAAQHPFSENVENTAFVRGVCSPARRSRNQIAIVASTDDNNLDDIDYLEAVKELAATKIQALWRGHSIRKSLRKEYDDVAVILKFIIAVDKAAKEDEALYARTSYGLYQLLNDQGLLQIEEACRHLSVATKLSKSSCVIVALSDAVSTLLKLFRRMKHDVSSEKMIRPGVSILLNLAKYDVTRCVVADTHGLIETLVRLLSRFHAGPSELFVQTSLVLIVICDEDFSKIKFLENPNLKVELFTVYAALLRDEFQSFDEETQVSVTSGAYSICKRNVAQKPFWKRGPWRFTPDWDSSSDKPRENLSKLEAMAWLLYAYRDLVF